MYHRRNSLRLQNYNYKSAGIYFITMCVNQRQCLFGDMENKKLKLNDAGKMIARIFEGLPNYYEGLISDVYAVMPDHFHGILIINRPVRAGLRARPNERRNIYMPHKRGFMSRENFRYYNRTKGDQFNTKKGGDNRDNRLSMKKGWAQRPTPTGDQLNAKMRGDNRDNNLSMKKGWAQRPTPTGDQLNAKMRGDNRDNNLSMKKGWAQRPTPTGDQLSLGDIVGRFKSYTTNQYINGVKYKEWKPFYEKLWQPDYYDRIIRNEKELVAIRQYILRNPSNLKS